MHTPTPSLHIDDIDLPETLRALALTGMIDTIGCGLAGGREAAARLIPHTPVAMGVTLFTGTERADVPTAALINATAAHALDFDDVSGAYDGHPSAVLVPALLALGEHCKANGSTLLRAYACGLEASAAIGMALGSWHYLRGFHATSVVGCVAAGLAAAMMLRLDADGIGRAIGIAASCSSGLRKNFGSMTKPYHAGLAARAGIEAALLARNGFTADTSIFDGEIGMLNAFGGTGGVLSQSVAFGGSRWLAAETGLAFKLYPCCYMLSRPLDAALALVQQGLRPEQIEHIHAEIGEGGLSALIHDRPVTGLEGKFSLPYAVCAALHDGVITPTTFLNGSIGRPAVQDLMRRFTCEEVPHAKDSAHGTALAGSSALTITLRDGNTLHAAVQIPKGSPAAPLGKPDIESKFMSIAGPVLEERADPLLARLWQIESLGQVGDLWTGML